MGDDKVKNLEERLLTAEAIEAAMGEHYVKAGKVYAEARVTVYNIKKDIEILSKNKGRTNSLKSSA